MKLEDRMRLSIRRRAGHVILRADVSGLGSASQVSHALTVLQDKGELVRLGAGVYAKAIRDAGTGAVRPLADFETLARETASKLRMVADPKAVGTAGTVQALADSGSIGIATDVYLLGALVYHIACGRAPHPA